MDSQSNSQDGRAAPAATEVNGEQWSSQISGDNNVVFVNSHVTVNNYVPTDTHFPPTATSSAISEQTQESTAAGGSNSSERRNKRVFPPDPASDASDTAPTSKLMRPTYPSPDNLMARWREKIDLLTRSETKKFTVSSDQGVNFCYSRESKIAAGSEGTHVFVGIFGSKPVAIKKCVFDSVKEKDKVVARSLLGKRLAHVLIPQAIIEDDNFVYYVSQLCEWNLQEVTEEASNPLRSTLNYQERLRMCREFLRGLKELHDLRVVHRDLKPSNVLLGSQGRVLVADFGVSRLLVDKTSTVTEGVGSMCWMAKEILRATGRDVRYDFSADIPVAGYLLYYILTDGHIPHESTFPYKRGISAVIENICKDKYSLKHLIDESLNGLVEAMINPVPQLRRR